MYGWWHSLVLGVLNDYVLYSLTHLLLVVSYIWHMNEVTPHQAQLVLGWVTIFRQVYHLGI